MYCLLSRWGTVSNMNAPEQSYRYSFWLNPLKMHLRIC